MNDLQKDDFILPGNIGTVSDSYGNKREITKVVKTATSTTWTISAPPPFDLENCPVTEDADFEVVHPKLIENK
jgi:hypothetical protein